MTEHTMEGAELASKEKSMLNNKLSNNATLGIDDESLHLTSQRIQEWQNDKLGLFIHWGVYSKIGKGEWAYFNEKYTEQAYRAVIDDFHPKNSPEEIVNGWLDAAELAGMRYAVMVTRHHDGYSMWDSKASYEGYTTKKLGPGEDYVHPFADACHERGIHLGLYYSPMDWRFPGYFDPKGQPESAAAMKKQCYQQMEELCRDFGQVDIIWYDGGWLAHQGTDYDSAWFWEPIKLNKMVRQYQPNALVTPRSGYKGDFQCDEGPHEVKGEIIQIPWEKSMSISSAWGYRPNDHFWSGDYLIRMLINVICRGGNLLLNVGPDENGDIPKEGLVSLTALGKWVKENQEAIYETQAGPYQPVDQVFGSTQNEQAVYIHILDIAACKQQQFAQLSFLDGQAYLLNGTKVTIVKNEGTTFKIVLPDYLDGEQPIVVKLLKKQSLK